MARAKKQQIITEEQEENKMDPEYQNNVKLEFKTIEESDYLDSIIQDRQKDIDQISNIMNSVKDIATDFNIEVDLQGTKLEDIDNNMDNVHLNTKEATKQLNEANDRSKKNGRCLMVAAVVIVL
jgi:t-SNARE complex subunit (syntaxin)